MIAYLHRGTGMARVGLECSIDLPKFISYCCCCGCGVDNAAEDRLNKQLRDGGDGGVKKTQQIEQLEQPTYCEKSDSVDSQLINVGVAHDCDCRIVVSLMRRSGTSEVVVEPEKFRKEDF
jgi:hypothetical protein